MNRFIQDPRDPIFFDPFVREYYLHVEGSTTRITFAFCPWCGSQLPHSLRHELIDIIETEYKLDVPIFEVKGNKLLPKEFETDEWWKKRGL